VNRKSAVNQVAAGGEEGDGAVGTAGELEDHVELVLADPGGVD
jgi:hypothetical protein